MGASVSGVVHGAACQPVDLLNGSLEDHTGLRVVRVGMEDQVEAVLAEEAPAGGEGDARSPNDELRVAEVAEEGVHVDHASCDHHCRPCVCIHVVTT